MRIAVVGAGFCGAALSYYLSKKHDVTLFDKGGSASRISSGLMHPYPGKDCRLSWRAHEGMAATKELLEISANALGQDVASYSGILRLEMGAIPQDTEYWPQEKVAESFPGTKHAGYFIREGVTVFPNRYIDGLIKASTIDYIQQKATNLETFDRVYLTAGAAIADFITLPLKYIRGHILTIEAPYKLPCSLIGKGYIAQTEDPNLWHIGSTYEHSPLPEEEAIEKIVSNLQTYLQLKPKIIESKTGVRVANKHDYRPIIEQLSEKMWAITGMGSRGLLYHALIAKELV